MKRAFLAIVAVLGTLLTASLAAHVDATVVSRVPSAYGMIVRVVDRREMRSFQPYSGLQFGFRPAPPIQRGVKTKRPRVVMPKRVEPLLEYGIRYPSEGYAYCADPPGDFEPRTGPYDPRPIERSRCP